MFIRLFLGITTWLFLVTTLKAQFFQLSLTSEGSDLIVSLVPTCGDITNISIAQVEFFIESNSGSSYMVDNVSTNTTNFPSAPNILLSGSSSISSGTQTLYFASPLSSSTPGTITYTEGTSYELARISLTGGTGTADFDLIAADDFSTYVNISVVDENMSNGDASYFLCAGGTGTSATSCPGTCTEINYFTGPEVSGDGGPVYTEAANNVPLPVELLNFTVQEAAETAVLKWESAQEINFKQYDIERSTDGKSFSTLAWVAGAGNTIERQQYSYHDKSIESGEFYYYRLKMVDLDESYDYSPIVALATKGSKQEHFHLSPNPVQDWVGFDLHLMDGEEVRVEIHEMSGKLVHTSYQTLEEGNNRVELETPTLSGIYLMAVYTKQNIFTARFMVK